MLPAHLLKAPAWESNFVIFYRGAKPYDKLENLIIALNSALEVRITHFQQHDVSSSQWFERGQIYVDTILPPLVYPSDTYRKTAIIKLL